MNPTHAPTLRRDLRLAVRLALGAAARLESLPRDARTACLYRVAFGHAPERRLPERTRLTDAGALAAYQFRRVAAALQRPAVDASILHRMDWWGSNPGIAIRSASRTAVGGPYRLRR
jgi:hypothetical protein